jgi:hypothetical protein
MVNSRPGDWSPKDEPQVEPHDVQALADDAERTMEAEGAATGELMASEDVRERQRQFLARSLEEAGSFFADVIERSWRAFEDARDRRNDNQALDNRFRRNYEAREEKFANHQTAPVDSKGRHDKDSANSHLSEGLSAGLMTDSVLTVGPALVTTTIGHQGVPVEFKPYGRLRENHKKRTIVSEFAKRDAREANWRGAMNFAIGQRLPLHGFTVLRQSWCESLQIVQEADGTLREVPGRRGMEIVNWNPLDVVFANPDRPYAWQQDAVIWRDWATMQEMEASRARFEGDDVLVVGPGGVPEVKPMTAIRGKYVNLEALRTAPESNSRTGYELQDFIGVGDDSVRRHASGGASWLRYCFQGYLQVGTALRMGLLSRAAFDWLLTNPIGTQIDETTGTIFPLEGEELYRLCNMLMWYATIVRGPNGWHIVQLSPCPYRESRNEALTAALIPSGGLYGYGMDDIAGDLADYADKVANDIARILASNAKPAIAANENSLKEPDAVEALEDGQILWIKGGSQFAAKDAVTYLLKPYSADMNRLLEFLIQMHNTRTMASQLGKGGAATTESDTAAEAQLQLQQTQNRLRVIATEIAETNLIVRSWVLWLKDLSTFYDPDELAEMAMSLGGEMGLGTENVWPLSKGAQSLADEFQVIHKGDATIRREVQAQMAMNLIPLAPQIPGLRPDELAKIAIEAQEIDPDRVFMDSSDPLAPDEEFRTLSIGGDVLEVHPMDDDLTHMEEHEAHLPLIDEAMKKTMAEGRSIAPMIRKRQAMTRHIEKHGEALLAKLAVAQAKLEQQQAAAGGEGEKPGGGSGQPPPGEASTANGIEASAGVQRGTGGPTI